MGSSSHTSKIKRGKDAVALDIIAYGFCGIIALVCLVPFIMIVSGSFSSESAIIQNGFSLLPQDFSLEAYKTVFRDPSVVFRAYATTIGLTAVGTVVGLLLQRSYGCLPRIRHDHRSDHRRNGTWSAAADYDSLCTVT